MRLATKVAGGFLAVLVVMAALAAYHLSLIGSLHRHNRELAQAGVEAALLALRIRSRIDLASEFSDKFLLLRDREYATELDNLRSAMAADLAALSALALSPDERQQLERVVAAWEVYVTEAPAREARYLERVPGESLPELRDALRQHFDGLRAELDEVLAVLRSAMETRLIESGAQVERARTAARVAGVVALLVAVVLSVFIVRSVAEPLKDLTRATHELALGEFSHRVTEPESPELAALARDFNSMAQRLSELDRLKRDFVSSVSHDLKAPLASMRETTSLMLEGLSGPLTERQRRLLQLNLQAGERLSAMIGALLDLSRLEAGAVTFQFESRDLSELAGEVVEEAQVLVEGRQLAVELELPGEPVVVECDPALLAQALRNLMGNAVKFTPEGGRLGVRVASLEEARRWTVDGARLPGWDGGLVEVWDTGPGVPDGQKERIFERFHRVDRERRGSQGGGLGLAIVRSIVAGHRGRVWVEDGPGGGSRFRVVLWGRLPSP